jgi:phage shock protein PspC (stress-responsive transcriptional regulator)
LAEYFEIDPVIPRIAWVVLALGAGVGVVAYLICWFAIPLEPVATGA